MDLKLRSFQAETDKAAMAALVHRHPAGHIHIVDLPYRLCSWAFDYPDNVALWEDDAGELVAWAVLQTPFWTLDYAYRRVAAAHAAMTRISP